MSVDPVRMWRAADDERVLWMAGRTSRYAIEPRGEYVFGLVLEQPMRSARGSERRLVRPGRLVAWDPSQAHAGEGVDGRPWASRLMVVEGVDLAALAEDPEGDPLADVAFPRPVLNDPDLVAGFARLHSAFARPSTRLERDERLAEWLATVTGKFSTRPVRRSAGGREDRAVRRAFDYLAERPERNVTLDELATAAGIGKFRLIRLFRERTGLPPHALQIAHRIRIARRLLEAGEPISDTAFATGFVDQSHLHRHFRRSLGLTPAAYQRRFRG